MIRRQLGMRGRTGSQQSVDVEHAEQEDEQIDRHEKRERDRDALHREKRCYGLRGAQHAVNRPWLAADFRSVPARQDGDERERKAQKESPQQPTALLDALAKRSIQSE